MSDPPLPKKQRIVEEAYQALLERAEKAERERARAEADRDREREKFNLITENQLHLTLDRTLLPLTRSGTKSDSSSLHLLAIQNPDGCFARPAQFDRQAY